MVNVNKKYVKIAVGGLAVSALVIGLSVGLTAKNKNNSNVSASNAIETYADFDENAADQCLTENTDGTAKAGKSGGSSRRLLVPGTEEYVAHVSGKKGQLRNDLTRRLSTPKSSKTPKSAKKSKSGQAPIPSICAIQDLCYPDAPAENPIEGDTGKTGKSGKSGVEVTQVDTTNGEKGETLQPTGKSGKSGIEADGKPGLIYCGEIGDSQIGGKSGGKSGRRKLSGKSGAESDTNIEENIDCISLPPSICETPSPSPSASDANTPSPTECDCSNVKWISFNGQCYRDCKLSCENMPEQFGSALTGECQEGFDNAVACCAFGADNLSPDGDCIVVDACLPDIIESPAPTPAPTPKPTECDCSNVKWISFNGQCYRDCKLSCENMPEQFGSALTGECQEGFENAVACCAFGADNLSPDGDCIVVDLCLSDIIESPAPTPAPTPKPTECDCSNVKWISFNGQCYRDCKLSCENMPEQFGFGALTGECQEGFENAVACCAFGAGNLSLGECVEVDACEPPGIDTPAPSPAPTNPVTEGSTPTVSTEVTGPPTTKNRPTTAPEPERA